MNLFVYDLATKQTRQLTHFNDFDIKFPSLGDKAIVFENGGCIYRFDLATREGRQGARSASTRTWPAAAASCATSART